jgi:hypothetical protein
MFPQFPWAGLVVIYKYNLYRYKNQILIFIIKHSLERKHKSLVGLDNLLQFLLAITFYIMA